MKSSKSKSNTKPSRSQNKLLPPQSSGHSVPIFSPSLPRNQKLHFLDTSNNNPDEDEQHEKKYYPNCDVNVWLRSCEQEIPKPLQGTTTGKIPRWLNGSLLRNGPGSLKAGNDYFDHLFDSSALLHRFGIADGKVTYQCRFVRSEVYKRNWEANRIVTTEFGTRAVPDPCHTIFRRVAAIFNPNKSDQSDNSMISVYPFRDEVYAFGETPVIHKIDPESLETDGRVNVADFVSIVHHTSHPHVLDDGSVYNMALSIYPSGPHHTIVHFPNDNSRKTFDEENNKMFENASIVAGIPVRWPLHPSYMHTFGVTENYFVIVEQPLNVSLSAMITSRLKNDPLAGCFRWYQNEKTQISLISRKTGRLALKFYSDAFFFLHIINQYEIKGHLVLDICIYRDPAMLDCMYISTMKRMQSNPDYAKMFRSKPVRYVLPLNPGRSDEYEVNLVTLRNTRASARRLANGQIHVTGEKLCDLGCETPRINYGSHLGKKYRYFYAISADVDAPNPGTIIKVDTWKKTHATWCEANCYPSEPIFVPHPRAKSEDDGIILSALVWGGDLARNQVGLLILDAKTFREIGRAEFATPGPVPKCLHGWYVPKNNKK